MKTLYQYAIVRFMPHAETGEFANVGIVLCAPELGLIDFRLAPTRFARVTDFFEDLNGKLYKATLQTVEEELQRLNAYAGKLAAKDLAMHMQEVVRPRETLVRYSELRTLYLEKKPEAVLNQLFEQLVHRTFLTEEYQENLMVKVIRQQLRDEKLTHFKQQKLQDNLIEVTLPLVAKTNDLFVIRPLAFRQRTATRVLDHAEHWLGRFRRLINHQVLQKQNILLPLQGPVSTDNKLQAAFKEVEQELTIFGVQTLEYQDKAGISQFARQALQTNGFKLQ
ncbi:DUF3037 domain-containing protein [Alkalimonas sp. MEB108]|uniref:DUF3037 domain-containing protein n=1 Tax=Alkalimonas cellulosilytica TaxID=3058395 RepID=A0ABU7J6X8_9GAMM|nr:DUF3037 domain-containing protein [Alkalimonas sp. MEB108]MEE2002058.1 DUF3037 domain-containing protein [Alkalimonas sp. MEB108]